MAEDAPLQGQWGRQLAFTGVGVITMALGIAVVTLAGIGTSPLSAPVWVATLAGGLSFGGWTLVINTLFLTGQLLILQRRFPRSGLLQIPATFVFSAGIDAWMWLIGWMQPEHYVAQVGQVLLGTTLLGTGVAIQVAPQILYLPGEGLLVAIARVWGLRLAPLKIAFDVTLVALAVGLSFLLFGQLRGLREGTVISALLTGVVVGRVMPVAQRALRRFLDPPHDRTEG